MTGHSASTGHVMMSLNGHLICATERNGIRIAYAWREISLLHIVC